MINEDEKAKKLDKWLELQKRWLHEKISLGKIFDVIQMAFYEGFEEGSKENDICTGCENPGNKWHFIRNKDLPTKDGYYEIALHNIDGDSTDLVEWFNNEWWTSDGEVGVYINEHIYAWKEMPLPLKEED